MSALKRGDEVGLVFTTVVDQVSLGLVDEDEEVQEARDRAYWENQASKTTVAMADQLLDIAKQYDASLELKYNRLYIGLAKHGEPSDFMTLKPKKGFIRFEPRLTKSPEIQERLENAGLDVMDYDARRGRYRIRLQPGEIEKNREVLTQVIKEAYERSSEE